MLLVGFRKIKLRKNQKHACLYLLRNVTQLWYHEKGRINFENKFGKGKRVKVRLVCSKTFQK